MKKRLLSFALAVSMLLTLLPVSAMAEDADTSIGASGEIIAFVPLDETERSVPIGKTVEELLLPAKLTATVRTAVTADSGVQEEPVQDSGEPVETASSDNPAAATTSSDLQADMIEQQETTAPEWEEKIMDIPVTWEAEPEYDGNENGVYIFTPVIAGYTVRAALPEITVTVGEMPPLAAARALAATDYGIWVGTTKVTGDNASNVLGDTGTPTVTYDESSDTLTLNNANITTLCPPGTGEGQNGNGDNDCGGIFRNSGNLNIALLGNNTVDISGVTNKSKPHGIYAGDNVSITSTTGGSLTVTGASGKYYSYGIKGKGVSIEGCSVTASSGNVTGTGLGEGTSVGICANTIETLALTIQNATVTAHAGNSSNSHISVGLFGYGPTISSSTITATGYTHAITFGPSMTAIGLMSTVTASGNRDGSDATSVPLGTSVYGANNYYQYVKITPAPAQWGLAGDGGAAPSTWTGGTLADAVSYANSLSSGTAYIQLLEDVTITAPLAFLLGKTTVLDLNGKNIDRGLSTASASVNGNVITVWGNLTLKDSSTLIVANQGEITGGHNVSEGGGVYVYGVSATFTMTGGNITGNKNTNNIGGGGVYVEDGAFTMTGGRITNNEAKIRGGGVDVNGGSFTMLGGIITGNSSADGGVYFLFYSNFTVGGTVVIDDNMVTGTSTECNIMLTGGTITVHSGTPLTAGASIGVTASTVLPVNVTGANSADYSSYFHSDNSAYIIQNSGSGSAQVVQLAVFVDPDIAIVAGAKSALIDGSVHVAFGASQDDKTAAVQGYVNDLLAGTGVSATVTYNSSTGQYDIAISKGSVDDSKSLSMTVNVAPDPDIAIVAAARNALVDGGIDVAFGADQTAKTAAVQEYVNDLLAGRGVSATVTYNGSTGKYDVALSKGNVNESKSLSMTVNIAPDPDIAIVAAARNSLIDGSVDVAFGADQTAKTAAVQDYVNDLLAGTGVSATVTYDGGTGKYDVALSKGSVNDSKSLSMTVNIAPDPDVAIVAAAKTTLIDGSVDVAFGADQTAKTAAAQDYVDNLLTGTGVSATVTYNGSTGKYDVALSKGNVNESKSLSITVHVAPDPDIAIVAAAKTALVDGSVNVAFGASQDDKTAAVQDYVNNLLSGTGVSATVTYDGGTGKYDVALSKGSVNDNKSLSMTVNIAPDPDIATVAAAKTAAQNASYANMTQAAATDEAAIQAALKSTAKTAINNGNITVTINKVSYTAPIAGTSANPSGTNGSYTFTVTVSKGSQSETTGQKTITITATPYTGGTGGGSSNGGGSTTPPSTKPTAPVTGSTENKAAVDNKGNASVRLTDKNITDAIADAKAEAAKKGVNAGDITAVIHVTTDGKYANTVTVNLPKTTQEQVISNRIANVQLVIDRPDLTIGIDLAAVTEINRQAKADVQLSATRMDNSKLSSDAKTAIGNRPAYDLKALYGSGKSVTNFGNGSVSVEIPYTLQKDEVAGNVYAVYVDTQGKVTFLTDSSYDAKRGTVVFSTSHFSTYGIAYKASFKFTDIDGHWAKDDILFVANRGLMTGTSATTFSPNSSMTRGMFVTALGRLANVDISAYKKSSFTDVKTDAYYMGYIEWGVKNNILVGIGGGKFDPDGLVTREQMAAIMDRYATDIEFKLSEVHTQNVFADNAQIGAWAAPSVKRIQMAGIIQGKNNNFYDPQGTATRAEVSAVLRRFVELTVFSDTAQGWVKNDSSQ